MPERQREKPGVLVVDDDHLVRIMVQLGLERNGFEVRLATNGREAIEVYREHRERISMVLLDLCLPGMDGPQILDGLREVDPDIRVCFVSGDSGKYTRGELLRRGAARVIAKPFLLNELADDLWLLAQSLPPTPSVSGKRCQG